jgi:multisubunit Na+/H+ antiporter MnhG subunit
VIFQLVTTPVAGHLLGRAAHASRARVSEHTVLDELRPLPKSVPVAGREHDLTS